MTYVPLGVRSEYSFHDGMCRIQELIERARSLKLDAVGIADRNSTYAWAPLEAAARRAKIQPIFGVRVVLASQPTRDTHDVSELVLQATNAQGLRNLLRLVSQAHLEGDDKDQAITMQDLERYRQGVLALDGGSQGIIQKSLRRGDVRAARKIAGQLQEIFNDGHFYVQVERHGTPEEVRAEPTLRRLARRSGIPLVASGNICYIERQDAEAYEVLRCLGSQRQYSDGSFDAAQGFRDKHHLHSPSEMKRLYQDIPETLETSRHIAEQCRLDLREVLHGVFRVGVGDDDALATSSGPASTESPVSAEVTVSQRLRSLCEEGACERFGTTSYQDVPAAARTRIAHELTMIEEKELASCFLIAQDVVRYAKEEGIPVGPGRGSMAGSLVAWVLEMTELDPLRFGLQFDGRLSKTRCDLPSLELEVGHRWRDQIIRKVQELAGRQSVVRMSTLARMHGRSLLHNVGKTLGVSASTLDNVDRLSRAHPKQKVNESLDRSERLRRLFQDDSRARRLLEVCSRLEGLPYHASLHAGALLLLPGEAMQRVALEHSSQGLRAQANEEQAEQFGWARIVVHGSSHLSTQHAAEKWVQQQQADFQLEDIELDDEATWRRIAHGDASGLPGLELPVARNVVRAVQPSRLSDLVACLTLASPVAQASGLTERFLATGRSGSVPETLKDVLEETGGWILYEEQVVQIAQRIAGYTQEQAWKLCEALRQDDLSRLVPERSRFLSGAIEKGVELKFAERVLDTLMAVRVGGESRGHAMAQALVAYRTAWMLTHYPLETLVELLNNSVGQSARQQRVLRMAVDQGCRILKVDVNASEEGYLVEDGAIRLAVSHVPSVGEATAAALVAARRRGGVFDSVQDVLLRVPGLHRMQVDALVEAGAFASLRDSSLAVDRHARTPGGDDWQVPRALSPEQASGGMQGVVSPGVVSGGARPENQVRGRSRRSRRVEAQMILDFDAVGSCQNAQQTAESVEPKPLADSPVVPASPSQQRDSRGGRPVLRAAGGRMWVVGALFGRGSGLGKSVEEV